MAKHEMKYMLKAIDQAKLSQPEDDEAHPLVGAIIVTENNEIESHRGGGGERGGHAEFVALDVTGKDHVVAGSTLYTTLEPCTD